MPSTLSPERCATKACPSSWAITEAKKSSTVSAPSSTEAVCPTLVMSARWLPVNQVRTKTTKSQEPLAVIGIPRTEPKESRPNTTPS